MIPRPDHELALEPVVARKLAADFVGRQKIVELDYSVFPDRPADRCSALTSPSRVTATAVLPNRFDTYSIVFRSLLPKN